jgi:hypothetical protein
LVIHMQQKKENDNIMNYDTVRLDDENNAIIIIDQTKLPGSIELIALKTAEEIWDAIYLLRQSELQRHLESIFWQNRAVHQIIILFMKSL